MVTDIRSITIPHVNNKRYDPDVLNRPLQQTLENHGAHYRECIYWLKIHKKVVEIEIWQNKYVAKKTITHRVGLLS